jgi:transketolase C-terminal domain/subunit
VRFARQYHEPIRSPSQLLAGDRASTHQRFLHGRNQKMNWRRSLANATLTATRGTAFVKLFANIFPPSAAIGKPYSLRTGRHERRPHCPGGHCVKLLGFMLLLAGWAIVLAAVALLAAEALRAAFVLAGAGVEVLGLALVARAQLAAQGEHD